LNVHAQTVPLHVSGTGGSVVNLGELVMILELQRQGLTISAISRRTGLDRKTVRKCLERGLTMPSYGPRAPRPQVIDSYLGYLRERLERVPELTAVRLLRELRELGYGGGYTSVKDAVRALRPRALAFEHRFETPPGEQAQVDFAHFKVVFENDPTRVQVVWLFSLVLGHSRWLWARFVGHQDLATLLVCHTEAFAALGGVPRSVLYDRMRSVVIDVGEDGEVIYNAKLLDLARHYGFIPRACAAYRAKTKGKVERPFRYIRQDFFLGRTFRDLEDLNAQLAAWLATVANVRVHGTTGRVIAEAFAEERPALQPLPALPYRAVLAIERRVSRDGMVSVGGNDYSVPDGICTRVVEVHRLIDAVQIFADGDRVAVHALARGRGQRIVAPGHRRWPPPGRRRGSVPASAAGAGPGDAVRRRSLQVYAAIGQQLARTGVP
jgi:transposase